MISKIEEPIAPLCQDCEKARARGLSRRNVWAGYKGPAVAKAKYIISDRKLCASHAGAAALALLLEAQK